MLLRFCALLLLAVGASAQTYSSNNDARLREFIEEALDRNPGVRESFLRYQAGLQRIPQVTSLPDPMLGVTQFARTPETRVGPQTTVLSLSQKFPWFGKLSDQGKLAAKDAEVLSELHQAHRAEVIQQVKLAYYDLAYIDRAIVITNEDEQLLGHYETLAQARYSQGIGLQQAVIKLQAEITRDRNRLQVLKRQRVDSEAALNTVRDQPAGTPVAPIERLSPLDVEIDLDALYAVGRDARPEVKAAFLEIEKHEKRIHLAERQYWPDLTLGASWGNVNGRHDQAGRLSPPADNGKDVYSVVVGVNLPIFRRKYDAGVQEATETFGAAREAYRDVVNEVGLSVRSVGFRIQTIEEQLALFEKALLPQAEQALRSTETAYATGTTGVLDLLDGERTLLEVRLGLARLETDYLKALADMERAIGSAFPEEKP
ncbi:MAG TPA: TolC family protein [Bryobacterales bacterium]|nr:TolC family protein [Bryobacterales bacterium]